MEMNVFSLVVFGIGVVALPLIFMKLVSPDSVRKNPGYGFVIAAFFTLIGFLAAYFIFSVALSMAMLAFASLMMLPFLVKLLDADASEKPKEDASVKSFTSKSFGEILKKHENLITFYMLLFFGMTIEYMFLYVFLPPDITKSAFSQQLNLFGPAGHFGLPYADILINNIQILFIAFVLSIFYGAGSIFVLGYNASIAGVMYGAPFKTLIWGAAATGPFYANLLSYVPHTIVEIMAYLFAAVAGGILVSRRDEDILEATFLFCIAIALIFFGWYLEVTVPGSF
jgi:uncharacterized membrane protein SpoIIM required for sporulation